MANPHRGEVELKAGAETYTLVYTTNAICALEKKLEKGLLEIVADMGRLTTVRALLWAGLQRHHKVSEDDAGDIMDKAGHHEAVAAVNSAVTAAFPPAEVMGENPR